MGGLDGVQEFDGYDEVDEDMVFHGGQLGGGSAKKESYAKESFSQSTGGRKRGKKSLAPVRSGRVKKRSGFGGIGGIDLRGFGDAATSILGITIGAIVLCGLLLYLTFGAHILPDFFGSLAAAMVIVVLLFYIAAKLLGRND
jgi:hypothetical protein